MSAGSTASAVVGFFKKSLEKSVEVKGKITEKISKIAETPTIVELKEVYNENEEHIQKITRFSKSTMNSVQRVLEAQKRTPISYIHCAEEIKSHYVNSFTIPVMKPAWYKKHTEGMDEWYSLTAYYTQFNEDVEKKYSKQIIVEPLPENKKKKDQTDSSVKRQRLLVHDDFFVLFHISDAVWVSKKNATKAKRIFGDVFWEKMGDTVEMAYNPDLNLPSITSAPEEEFVASEKAVEISQELEKFLAKGHNRSVLFYGPPGTGKSNIVKNIAARLGKRTLRLNFSHIKYFPNFLNEWLLICQPDVLIIEDIDHEGDGGGSALTTLEKMNKNCKLLLTTANAVTKLNDAVIRPGRFDKLVEIDKMDDRVLLKIVGGDQEVFDLVKNYPIASIMEVMKRIEVLGRDEALKTIADIQQRIRNTNTESCKLASGDEAAPAMQIKIV